MDETDILVARQRPLSQLAQLGAAPELRAPAVARRCVSGTRHDRCPGTCVCDDQIREPRGGLLLHAVPDAIELLNPGAVLANQGRRVVEQRINHSGPASHPKPQGSRLLTSPRSLVFFVS